MSALDLRKPAGQLEAQSMALGRWRTFTSAIPGTSDLSSSTSQVLDYSYEPSILIYALPKMEARAC